jgi:xylulose-5-phosphate/fructose-6-phosphate phosphoketolase
MTTTQSDLTGISAFGPARATVQGSPLTHDELRNMDSYWSACCYLILGMLYLRENPLLREPLKAEHIKPRLLVIGDPARGNLLSGCISTG